VSTRRRLSTTERRAAILDAARTHFTTTDYPSASVPAIAAASGSSQSLVFHYFSSKAGLYASVVEDSLRALREARLAAVATLTPGHPVRDRISRLLQVHLDALQQDPTLLPGAGEPESALRHRQAAHAELVDQLREIIGVGDFPRHTWALWGWVGFLDHAGHRWMGLGCPEDQRWPLIDSALGALEGALGDWAV
jgi:AcrR family transcriptional regulator